MENVRFSMIVYKVPEIEPVDFISIITKIIKTDVFIIESDTTLIDVVEHDEYILITLDVSIMIVIMNISDLASIGATILELDSIVNERLKFNLFGMNHDTTAEVLLACIVYMNLTFNTLTSKINTLEKKINELNGRINTHFTILQKDGAYDIPALVDAVNNTLFKNGIDPLDIKLNIVEH